MRNVGRLIWTLFLTQCAAIALLFGGYWASKANINDLRYRNRMLEERLAAAERTLEDRARAPAPEGTQAPFNVEPTQPGKPPAAGATATGETSSSDAATQPPPKTVEQAVADTLVCVDKNTHAIVPCERAASCLGLKSFDVAYFNGLRSKLGISSPMMICNMKAAESESPLTPTGE